MAEHAQQEPTMEEILSSIRKIIADDEQPRGRSDAAVSDNVVDVREADDDVFDDLDLSFDDDHDQAPQTEVDMLSAITQAEPDAEALDGDVFDPVTSFDDLMSSDPETVVEDDSFEIIEDDDVFAGLEDDSETPVPDVNEFEAGPVVAEMPAETEPMAAEHPPIQDKDVNVTSSDAIADSRTVDAAAGSLGKLLSKVEPGGAAGDSNTIDGLVRELLRPMLKEWLDENLPAIVERSVEAEVQRIARMAR